MDWTYLVVFIIGLMALLEGIFITFMPKTTKKMLSSLVKNQGLTRIVGFVEILLAIAIIILSFSLKA